MGKASTFDGREMFRIALISAMGAPEWTSV